MLGRQVHAQDAPYVGRRQGDLDAGRGDRIVVQDAPRDSPTGQLTHEFGRPLAGVGGQGRVDAAPEAGGCLAGQLEGGIRPAGVDVVEVGGLQQDARRPLAHLGVQPAHDARDGNRPGCVGDEQHVGRQLAAHIVQRDQLLAWSGAAHDNRRRLPPGSRHQLVVVEGVQGLPQFEHDVVGDVHDVGDGPHAGQGHAPLHPGRCVADGHALDDRGAVAVAQVRVFDDDAGQPFDRRPLGGHLAARVAHRLPRQRGDLASRADNVRGAGQVGG